MPHEVKSNTISTIQLSSDEYSQLLLIIRRVVPRWLRQRHHTLSLVGQTVEELLTDEVVRLRFETAAADSDNQLVATIWSKLACRIRDRLKKRISRSREVSTDIDYGIETIDLEEMLSSIDTALHGIPEAQSVFREFYVPLIDCTRNKRPSVAMVQSFLGSGTVWAREIRQRVEDAIASCCTDV